MPGDHNMVKVLQQPQRNGNMNNPFADISPSRLKSFLSCRLRFFMEKVLAIKSPPSGALHLGRAVHHVLEVVHRKKWKDEPIDHGETLDFFLFAFQLLEDEDPVKYKDDQQRVKILETGYKMIDTYLKSDYFKNLGKPKAIEVRLEDPCGLDVGLLGIVDLISRDNVLIDFKTVANTPNVEHEAKMHETQLVCYQMLFEATTGEACNGLELVYITKHKEPKIIVQRIPPATNIQKERFISLCNHYVDENERMNYYPSAGMHCNWCSLKEECNQWSNSKAHAQTKRS